DDVELARLTHDTTGITIGREDRVVVERRGRFALAGMNRHDDVEIARGRNLTGDRRRVRGADVRFAVLGRRAEVDVQVRNVRAREVRAGDREHAGAGDAGLGRIHFFDRRCACRRLAVGNAHRAREVRARAAGRVRARAGARAFAGVADLGRAVTAFHVGSA